MHVVLNWLQIIFTAYIPGESTCGMLPVLDLMESGVVGNWRLPVVWIGVCGSSGASVTSPALAPDFPDETWEPRA